MYILSVQVTIIAYKLYTILFVRQLLQFHSLHNAVGPPCQAPITYSRYGTQYRLLKSDNYGVCYAPNPIYEGQPPRPYIQKQENAKATNSVSLCEEGEGCKEIPNITGIRLIICNVMILLLYYIQNVLYHPAFFIFGGWGGGR